MKIICSIVTTLFVFTAALAAETPAAGKAAPSAKVQKTPEPAPAEPAANIPVSGVWGNIDFILGDWNAFSTLEKGEGEFSFAIKTNFSRERSLIRENVVAYPAQNGQPASVHRDLMKVEPGENGNPPKALFLDNEGNVISYTMKVNETEKTVVFTSFPKPSFILTYKLNPDGTLGITFSIQKADGSYFDYKKGIGRRK